MDFEKDNFEEDNELAPLEEEEAGDVEEVTVSEVRRSGLGRRCGRGAPAARRGSGEPQRAAAGASAPRKKAARKPAKKASAKKAKLRQKIQGQEIQGQEIERQEKGEKAGQESFSRQEKEALTRSAAT